MRFWATPPIHGVLRTTVVHPEAFTFKLPDNVSFAEAAMLSSGAIGVTPLITRKFEFDDSVRAFEMAASEPKGDVKMQIELPQ